MAESSSTETDVPKIMGTARVPLPYITIRFCTQCKWNLRAAYFAQELLQTFSTTLGGIALVPVTGGIFTITVITETNPEETLLWDRKSEGGFPETKELKNRVRNIVDPQRDMGHIDRSLRKDREGMEPAMTGDGVGKGLKGSVVGEVSQEQVGKTPVLESAETRPPRETREECEDCR